MYANIIVDITNEQLDRVFQYLIPPHMDVRVGSQVLVSFGKGNRRIKGYVIEVTEQAEFDISRMKSIEEVLDNGIAVESQLIQLAFWMKVHYGSTMIQALKTVMPMRQKVKPIEKKYYMLRSREKAEVLLEEARRRKWKVRIRLLEALLEEPILPGDVAIHRLNITAAAVRPLIENGAISAVSETEYRNPIHVKAEQSKNVDLNLKQRYAVSSICESFDRGDKKPSLIYGITGSGKTEVYMEIIAHVLNLGYQAIVLIPEIALTYQTVMRFYKRFGERISIINSRLSAGEKYDQIKRAQTGEIDVMIGPRSALFTPFPKLGLVIIDEEHEDAYKSEYSPKYHARETAIERARLSGGMVVMGSATPSLEAYSHALERDYHLYRLNERAVASSKLADVCAVDLREELKEGNRSIFSGLLKQMIQERLERKEQILLFLNRRGYSGFVSCRACGKAIGCPHCDVALTAHSNQILVCHYCGYTIPYPKECPSCHSPYIAGFGLGTQKVEAMAAKEFPNARVLRMDFDTTSGKNGHEEILSVFSAGEADILVGTQMIVKGHDFPNVTLVGILAADMSLFAGDYRSAEKTFQLLTQAAGRAGRGQKAGNVIIQTYNPDHYSIQAAKNQDYEMFYQKEMTYRRLLNYPPCGKMAALLLMAPNEVEAERCIEKYASLIQSGYRGKIDIIGPSDASVSKIKDTYRKMMYLKSSEEQWLIEAKDKIEMVYQSEDQEKKIRIQFDFN